MGLCLIIFARELTCAQWCLRKLRKLIRRVKKGKENKKRKANADRVSSRINYTIPAFNTDLVLPAVLVLNQVTENSSELAVEKSEKFSKPSPQHAMP